MRNPLEEARQRVDGRYDVRVLEPSPSTSTAEPPWFADDPLDGGDVLPIERTGAGTWLEISDGDAELRSWCEARWLVPHPLPPLPPAFAATRAALHALAEEVIAPARQRVNGKIGLRYTYQGFGTPFFDGHHQLRVEAGVLVVDNTLREPLDVNPDAACALGDWYGYCCSLLEQLRADACDADAPGRVQLWPEHFDLAVDIGADGTRANYGGSPGDETHAEPYLYVGPWGAHGDDPFWNESFGASLPYAEILAGADGLAFLRRGKELLG